MAFRALAAADGMAPGVVGQGGCLAYAVAGVSVAAVERASHSYYSRPMRKRAPTLRLLHALKVGFLFGCVLDVIEVGG